MDYMTAVKPQPVTQNRTAIENKSLFIFDWDGTLMDSIGLIVEAMHVAGEANGFKTNDDMVKSIIGLSLSRGIELIYPEASEEQRTAIERSYATYYIDASTRPDQPHSQFFKGIEPMLQKLQSDGKQLAVATGKKRAGLDRVMAYSNSEHYFVATRCADESGSKPDPQMLIDILHETNNTVDDALYVGDSIHDIEMANALGMMSIAVNYGAGNERELAERQPDYQCDTPQQLIELLTS